MTQTPDTTTLMGVCGLLPPPRLTDPVTLGTPDTGPYTYCTYIRARHVWRDGDDLVLVDDAGDTATVPMPTHAPGRDAIMRDLLRLSDLGEQHTCRILVALHSNRRALQVGWECEELEAES